MFDVVIVGGGLAGASLAVALRKSRMNVALVETRPPVRPAGFDQRVYAISPASQAFLQDLGVWENMALERLCPVSEMAISGDAGGFLRFSAYDSGLSELAWICESSVMQHELWETVRRQHNVSLFCPAECDVLIRDESGITLKLSDGRTLRSRLVVGADGVRSWVRSRLGIDARFTPYDEHAIVANFRVDRAHHDVAFQWFLGDAIVALLPLPEQMMSLVWSAPDDEAAALMALSDEAFCRHVERTTQCGTLEIVTARAAFPLRLMRVDQLVCERGVLIGDAAHAIHPLSGHGINLGFQDARVLAGILGALPAWEDPGTVPVLRRYARQRAEEPALMQAITHGLNKLFSARARSLKHIRNAGMQLSDRLPVIKDVLIRYATLGHF